MYYSININQIAIARHNKKYNTNFDLVDGAILEYLQKQSTSAFAKRNYKIFDGLVFYLLFYDNIIQQLPLIKIENRESIGRRIKKLADANVILQKVEKIPNNGTKIYFTTTDIFETFFSYDTTQKSDGDTTQKSDGDTTQKSDDLIDKNITDKSINDKKDTASGFSSESNYSEIPNSSVCKNSLQTQSNFVQNGNSSKAKENLAVQFQDFWKEFCNMCKAKGSTAGEKKPAEIEYQKAVKIAGHQGIMRTLEVFRDYILLAFENNKHACRWLKNINWQDFEEAINNYKQQTEVLKAEAKKQGKPLPVAQKTPEKQQEEVKMNEDAEKKRDSVIRHLHGEEIQFMKHIKETLKTNFDAMHRDWIDDLVFSCRNKVAYFGFTKKRYIDIVQSRLEKFTQCIMREIATFEGLEAERIELKLID